MVRVCYVDDVGIDRERYEGRLSADGLAVKGVPPPEDLDLGSIIRTKPDALLIDYVLDKRESGRPLTPYQGATLAARFREAFPDHPIVLLTREELLTKSKYQQMKDILHIFDEVLYKGDVETNPASSRLLLGSLATGFKLLRQSSSKSWKSLLRLLKAPPEAENALRKAGPPLSTGTGASVAVWRVQEAARWIRKVVLAYPGILYDKLHSATALGMDLESFQMTEVKKLFTSARYRGPFEPPGGRWWRARLYGVAQRLIAGARLSGPANVVLREAYKERFGVRLKPARCIYSKSTPADWVCYILRKPVKRQFSLAYHPDDRPAVMDEARVSFKAIREDNRVRDELFDEQSQGLLSEIRKLRA